MIVRQAQGLSARAGLKRGDIIMEIAGKAVHSREDFETAMRDAGKNVPILIKRNGSTVFLALILP